MESLNRREFLSRLAGGITAAGFTACGTPWSSEGASSRLEGRPNFLFIMSDDHASHALSCYGSRINQTPNLDRIAREGIRFKNCFVTNSICAPSRAVILTGKYSHLNGVLTNGEPFDGSQQTFPKLLRQSGYQTAIVGKWHLKSEPTGFDYWNILPGQGLYHNPSMIEMGETREYQGYVTELITDKAMEFLQSRRDKTRPFFLMVHHKAPHRNWQPDEKHAKRYEDQEIPEPETFNDGYSHRASPASRTTMTIAKDLTQSDVKGTPPKGLSPQEEKKWYYQRYIKDYLRCVSSVDENVGRLLDTLDRSGLSQNTVVIYTSDQGFFLGDHGWYDKRFMYEESLRMPLAVRYPGRIQPGTVSDAMVLNLDFAPTFLHLAGVPVPGDMQGVSIKPILLGRTPEDWRTSMYYHYYEYPAVHSVRRHFGVRTKRYKLIHYYYQMDEWELFDLEKDPHELRSVYGDPAYAEVVKTLKAELNRLRRFYGDNTGGPSPFSHPHFDRLYDVQIKGTEYGYDLLGKPGGYALRKAAKPFRKKAIFRCRLKTLEPKGTRNGLLAFGPTLQADDLIKAGVYIGVGEAVILYGTFGGSGEEIIRRPMHFDKGKDFRVEVCVDLEKREVRLKVDDMEVEAPLKKKWDEINTYGYCAFYTSTSFSPIEVEGE